MDFNNFGLILEAETTDCTIEVYLNDIPLGLCGLGGSRTLSRPIHEFVLDGENEIGVLVNPGDSPAAARQFSREERPAFGAQPPPDPAMDSFVESRRKENQEKREKETKAKAEANGQTESVNGESEENTPREESTLEFKVQLNIYEAGVVAGGDDPETLLELSWNSREAAQILRKKNPAFPLAEENAVGPQLFPLWLTIKGDLGEMLGSPHWLNAPPLTLNQETIEEVTEFVFYIRDLVEEGEAGPILDISTEMYREVAAAYNISAEERAGLFRQLLAEESKEPYWIFETPEDDDFSFRLCANGRLIECIGPDWKPIVRGIPSPKGRFLYPMLIGKIGDEWRIMR